MLKNIAEKIDKMEQKRLSQSISWKDDIERYKKESEEKREENLAQLNNQLEDLEKKRLEEAASPLLPDTKQYGRGLYNPLKSMGNYKKIKYSDEIEDEEREFWG